MNVLPVSARSLHRGRVRIGDDVFENASLFPFFDHDGHVRQVLVLQGDSSQIGVLRWRASDFVVPLLSSVRVTGESAWLRPVSYDRLDELCGMWHYDPRWLLDAPRYRTHPLVEYLKATNCADRFSGNVRTLWFRRDLSRLSWVEVKSFSEFNLQRWHEDFLPAKKPSMARPTAAAPKQRVVDAWQLDPVWAQWTRVHQNVRQ